MDIIIAGDGEVGFNLAEALVDSNHNITVIDPHEELLKRIESHADLLTVVGESNSVSVLRQAHVDKADLLVSVLHDEHINILTAILAKKLGAKRVIARVNTLEKVEPNIRKVYEELGIDVLISPEDIAGHEVVSLLHQTVATDIVTFSHGKLSVYLFKIREGAPVAGKTLNQIAKEHKHLDFRAVAIHRDSHTIIPKGENRFEEGDLVYVISKPEAVDELANLSGIVKKEINNIFLVGGGRVGKVIAMNMEKEMNIKLIEKDHDRCMALSNILDDTLIINGDARDINLLEEEGIEGIDAFIAVTDSSETNIVSCLHAKKFGIPKTIALVENLDYIEISQSIGIDTIINKKKIAASYIIKHSMGTEVSALRQLIGMNAEVLEMIAHEGSPITKKPISAQKMPEGAIIGGIIRGHESFIATGDFQIQPQDKVVVFALPGIATKIEKLFHKSRFLI